MSDYDSYVAGKIIESKPSGSCIAMKTCKTCSEKKPLDEFYSCDRCKDGTRNDCKNCVVKKQSAVRDPEKNKQKCKEWYAKNKERSKAYRQSRTDQRNKRRKERYKEDEELRMKARQKSIEWQRSNPEKRKAQRLKKYGISLEDHRLLMDKQDWKCAICGYSDLSKSNFFPVVDHCHDTGKVRGMLCMNCNNGLGKFLDSPEFLRRAADYLEEKRGNDS